MSRNILKKKKNRFKAYFTEKPKTNFWFWAFITLLLFRYVSPYALIIIIIPLLLGLAAPESDLTPTFENLSEKFTDIFIGAMQSVAEAGATIATNNPIFAKVLFFIIANCVYVIWGLAIALTLNFIRYGIFYLFFNKKKEVIKNGEETEKI